jgi:hypothetical protein
MILNSMIQKNGSEEIHIRNNHHQWTKMNQEALTVRL